MKNAPLTFLINTRDYSVLTITRCSRTHCIVLYDFCYGRYLEFYWHSIIITHTHRVYIDCESLAVCFRKSDYMAMTENHSLVKNCSYIFIFHSYEFLFYSFILILKLIYISLFELIFMKLCVFVCDQVDSIMV